MNNKTTLAILSLLLFASFKMMHDYHVCISEIKYERNSKTLTYAHKLFIDDLEKALDGKVDKLAMGLENKEEKAVQASVDFIEEHLRFYAGEKALERNFVGYEWEDHHGIWFYFKTEDLTDFHELSIENDIFTDLFEKQENIHYITVDKLKKTVVLNREMTEGSVHFGE